MEQSSVLPEVTRLVGWTLGAASDQLATRREEPAGDDANPEKRQGDRSLSVLHPDTPGTNPPFLLGFHSCST